MMNAAAGIFLAARRKGKPTARSYVQDGLIAMWDGIENAGWGVHDSAATTWKDLSGNGLDLTVDAGSVTWYADHVVPSTTNAANHVYRANARTEISAIGTPTTVECVFLNPYKSDFRILAALTFQGDYRAMCKSNTVIGVSGFLRSAPSGVVIQCSSSSTSMLVNGVDSGDVVLTNRLTGAGRAYQDISIFGVRGLSWNAMYAIETSLYCLRVYSRDLPENERIANSAVDKARFNLP